MLRAPAPALLALTVALAFAAAAPTLAAQQPAVNPADVRFVSGMIAHHAQAVLIAGWAASHGASPALQSLCDRIVVGQRDEIVAMQRWLRERQQPVPEVDTAASKMAGMEHPMLMPGMLTAAQLVQLDSARGPEFDRLFLTDMIQHHRGALTMVRELIDVPGAARGGMLFQVSSDIAADQAAEIDRMTRMLNSLSPTSRSPQ